VGGRKGAPLSCLSVAITTAQQGDITEAEFVKFTILTSNGALVPTRPVVDDARVDYEIHIKKHFQQILAVQMKTARRVRIHGRTRRLQIDFNMRPPLIIDPRLWFVFAHFDIPALGLGDPLFVVPSEFFIRNARHGFAHGAYKFQFQASMEATAHDKWTPWQVKKVDLGSRLMEILEDLKTATNLGKPSSELLAVRNVIWVPTRAAAFESVRRRAA
jgi:hypothetical protein